MMSRDDLNPPSDRKASFRESNSDCKRGRMSEAMSGPVSSRDDIDKQEVDSFAYKSSPQA